MSQTIVVRSSYSETESRDFQSKRYGLDLEVPVILNGGDHRQEIETAAATLFNFSKAIVAKQKEAGMAVNDLFNGHSAPLPQPDTKPQSNGNGGHASAKQTQYIRQLCKRNGHVPEQLARDQFKKDSLDALTAKEASLLIEGLKT